MTNLRRPTGGGVLAAVLVMVDDVMEDEHNNIIYSVKGIRWSNTDRVVRGGMTRQLKKRGAKVRRGERSGPRRSLQWQQCWWCGGYFEGWYPVKAHRYASRRRFCSDEHAADYRARVDFRVHPRKRLMRCPVDGTVRRDVRFDAVYCSPRCKQQAWRDRRKAEAQAVAALEAAAEAEQAERHREELEAAKKREDPEYREWLRRNGR